MAGPEIFPSIKELDEFKIGVVVWGLIAPSPWWPARIVDRDEVEQELETNADFPPATESNRMMDFFGENTCSVMDTSEICEFTANIHLAKNLHANSKVGKACALAYKYLAEESPMDIQKSLFEKLPSLKVVRKGEEARSEFTKSPKKARGRMEQPPSAKQKPSFSLKEWKDRGISSQVVGELDVPELGSAVAAYLRNYRTNVNELFLALRDCLNKCFKRERITGSSLVGRDRLALDKFERCVGDALAADAKVGKCLGYEIELRRFHTEVGWNAVQSRNALGDWGALGVRRGVVEGMDSQDLAKCLVAYMLGYDGKSKKEFEEMSKLIGEVLKKDHISGSTVVGEGRLVVDDFIAVLTKEATTKEIVSKAGHDTSIRKFFNNLE